jgi:hypothetical protein
VREKERLSMNQEYDQILVWMDVQLEKYLALVPAPVQVRIGRAVVYRFLEKSPSQAVVQKLARIISGLRAAEHLLSAGFLQEQAALCRMINEYEEDVVFLSLAGRANPAPDKLQQYLNAFYEEEASVDQWRSKQKVKGRATVSRQNISKSIARLANPNSDPFEVSNVSTALAYTFAGYVHGTSTHIMEMYDPVLRRFETLPRKDHPFQVDHEHDMWNYFYRGILSFEFGAYLLDKAELVEQCREYRALFENHTGRRS